MTGYEEIEHGIFNPFGALVSKVYVCRADAEIAIYYLRKNSNMINSYYRVDKIEG